MFISIYFASHEGFHHNFNKVFERQEQKVLYLTNVSQLFSRTLCNYFITLITIPSRRSQQLLSSFLAPDSFIRASGSSSCAPALMRAPFTFLTTPLVLLLVRLASELLAAQHAPDGSFSTPESISQYRPPGTPSELMTALQALIQSYQAHPAIPAAPYKLPGSSRSRALNSLNNPESSFRAAVLLTASPSQLSRHERYFPRAPGNSPPSRYHSRQSFNSHFKKLLLRFPHSLIALSCTTNEPLRQAIYMAQTKDNLYYMQPSSLAEVFTWNVFGVSDKKL